MLSAKYKKGTQLLHATKGIRLLPGTNLFTSDLIVVDQGTKIIEVETAKGIVKKEVPIIDSRELTENKYLMGLRGKNVIPLDAGIRIICKTAKAEDTYTATNLKKGTYPALKYEETHPKIPKSVEGEAPKFHGTLYRVAGEVDGAR